MVDRIAGGESVDLDALAQAYPDGVERVRRLVPVLALMSRLRAPSEVDARNGSGVDRPEADIEPVRELGDFRTIRVIGRGGMGVVYEAVQVSLNRRVALKILPMTSAEDPGKLKRFQIEAQAAALLNHPHIVPIYLVGSECGAHFYAMQLIAGRTLAEVIAEFRQDAWGDRGCVGTVAAVRGRAGPAGRPCPPTRPRTGHSASRCQTV